MPDETTPAQPQPQPQPQPRPRRVDRKALRLLREPIPEHNVGKRPRVYCWACNQADKETPGRTCIDHRPRWCKTCRSTISPAHDHDDYVGHAEVTDRLLEADLTWTWEPWAVDERGLPALDDDGGLWIWLTVGGVKRPGYGSSTGHGGAAVSEAISNALKNAGQRFGIGLNQRAQTDLHAKPPEQQQAADTDDPGETAQDAGDAAVELEYARPDWVARVNSLLARKYGAHGQDRLRELSEILERDVTDIAKISPAEARTVVQILSPVPDLNPPAPAAATPDPEPDPAPAAAPPPEPAPAADNPEPTPPHAAPARRGQKQKPPASVLRPGPAPVAPGPGAAHVRTINSLLSSRGVPGSNVPARMRIISTTLGRPIGSMDELSRTDAEVLIRKLGSGEASVDPPAAAAADTTEPEPEPEAEAEAEPEPEPEPENHVFDELCQQIRQAVTDEDAQQIKVGIGKALTAGTITKYDGADLSERLNKRGRQVGLAGTA